MDSSIFYTTPRALTWDWRIAADLFLGGIGVGCFFVLVLEDLVYRCRHLTVTRLAAWASPLFLIAGIALLLSEMGHPERIWYTITGFNVTSPLSWGGVCQGLLILIGLAYAVALVRPSSTWRLRLMLGMVGIPIGLIVGTYHGFLLTAVRARPLWSTGPATVAAILAFLTTGIALVCLGLCLHRRSRELLQSVRDMRWLLGVALLAQVFTLCIWWVALQWGPQSAREALQQANAAVGPLFWFVAIGLGLVLPLMLGAFAIIAERRTGELRVGYILVTSLMILVGGFVFRYAVVIGGQVS